VKAFNKQVLRALDEFLDRLGLSGDLTHPDLTYLNLTYPNLDGRAPGSRDKKNPNPAPASGTLTSPP